MNWLVQIENELQRVRRGENPGRTRTIARRIAGIALQHFYKETSRDFLQSINFALQDDTLPDPVRNAIDRLAARLDAQFQSPSVDPLGDAMIVVEHVKKTIE